jgi:COMPASS component SWD3
VKKTYQGHKNSGFSIGGAFGVLPSGDDGHADPPNERGEAFVASASEDGDIVMWNVKSKQIVQRIPHAHEGVCFWVDVKDEIMASAGRDGFINVFKNKRASKGNAVNGVDRAASQDVNGHGEGSVTPYEGALDDELQRQIEAGASTPLVKQEDMKSEEL